MVKTGRPKKDKTKMKAIGIRLSDEEYELLMQYASEQKLTITQVVQLALEKLFRSQ